MDEDAVGLERALTGEAIVVCEFCGQPVSGSSVGRVEGVRGVAEPVECLHVCQDCRDRIEQDEVPFDEEIAAGLQTADE
jgi:hypothetical protein